MRRSGLLPPVQQCILLAKAASSAAFLFSARRCRKDNPDLVPLSRFPQRVESYVRSQVPLPIAHDNVLYHALKLKAGPEVLPDQDTGRTFSIYGLNLRNALRRESAWCIVPTRLLPRELQSLK